MPKRYLRRGPGTLPTIYPGDLSGLEQVIEHAQKASESIPGVHKVYVHEPGTLTLIKVFADGHRIDVEETEDND